MKKIYLFGYGSLQNFSSIEKSIFMIKDDVADIDFLKRNLICCSPILKKALEFDKEIQIIRVKNMRRGWFFNVDTGKNVISKPWTTLGANRVNGFTTNGTLFPVTEEQLALIDIRESGYIREEINQKDIEFISNGVIPNDSIIYYYAFDEKKISKPSEKYPLLQSYIDICMIGCIETDQLLGTNNYEYTKEFVATTYSWLNLDYYINDRIYNRRPGDYVPYAGIIDIIINKYVIA
jgi:hypothetical protein